MTLNGAHGTHCLSPEDRGIVLHLKPTGEPDEYEVHVGAHNLSIDEAVALLRSAAENLAEGGFDRVESDD